MSFSGSAPTSLRQNPDAAHQQSQEASKPSEGHFAMVLIDGDGYKFLDSLTSQGQAGGVQAAQNLTAAVRHYLDDLEGTSEWTIIIRIFCNLGGLANKYQQLGLAQNATIRQFAIGLNQGELHVNLVDVGPGDQEADKKLIATFDLFARNIQCKHILLACCHDNGYIPLLKQPNMQSAVAPGITLIQTSRMTYKYKQLSYEPLRLNSIFRETDLSSRHLAHRVPTSSLQTSPGLVDYGKAPRLHDRSAGAVASKKRPRAKSEEGEVSDDAMRSRGSTTQAPNSIVNDGFVFRESQGDSSKHFEVYVNAVFERIDMSYPQATRETFARLDVDRGSLCRNPNCLFGHHCPWEDHVCNYKAEERCNFRHKHGIDREIAWILVGEEDTSKHPKLLHEGPTIMQGHELNYNRLD